MPYQRFFTFYENKFIQIKSPNIDFQRTFQITFFKGNFNDSENFKHSK